MAAGLDLLFVWMLSYIDADRASTEVNDMKQSI